MGPPFFRAKPSSAVPKLDEVLLELQSAHSLNYYAPMLCKKGIETTAHGLVPCGKCMNCRIRKREEWMSRIMMETFANPNQCYFLTLTYSDKKVPRTVEGVPNLCKRELQAWVKDVKRKEGPFRYFAVGEYGEKSLRPHYHLALFPYEDSAPVRWTRHWEAGFTSAFELTPERARYIARYTTKKLTSDTDPRLEAGQEPEFRIGSNRPGLGAAYVAEIVSRYQTVGGQKFIRENGDIARTFKFGGKTVPISRYCLSKARAQLGIPQLERDRAKHDGYDLMFPKMEPKQCQKDHEANERYHHAKAHQTFHRGSQKV